MTWFYYNATMLPVQLNVGGPIILTDRGLKAIELLETVAVFADSFCGVQGLHFYSTCDVFSISLSVPVC